MHAYVSVVDGEDDRAHGETVERGVFHVVAKEGGEFFVEEFLEALMPMAGDRGFGARPVGEFAIAHGMFLGGALPLSSNQKRRRRRGNGNEGGMKRPRGQKKET